jgi:hypothetical protein
MTNEQKTLSELNEEIVLLLTKKVGVVNTFRFINQFTKGQSDYTLERRDLYKEYSLNQILSEIKKARPKRK